MPADTAPFGRVLIAGTGPTSVQLAAALKNVFGSAVGIAGRQSNRSAAFFRALRDAAGHAEVAVQNPAHRALEGRFRFDRWFEGYESLEGSWETLVVAATANAYTDILRCVQHTIGTAGLHQVILVSPTFGSHALVQETLDGFGTAPEVISLSSYLGDTRWQDGAPSTEVLTAGAKKRIYAGSSAGESDALRAVRELHERLGVQARLVDGPLAAESRNISLYVHPALFMNNVTLGAVFGDPMPTRYVYKLFPEGPITPTLIAAMLGQWREMGRVLDAVGVRGVNLLKFMVDDSYPVRPESISRTDIERFESLSETEQRYLLYVRYASLLIDPFSTPDENGRYFDFSGVPIRPVFTDADGVLDIPRMPSEDYYRTKIIAGIAERAGISCPAIDGMLDCYETWLRSVAEECRDARLSEAFTVQDFADDVDRIWRRLRRGVDYAEPAITERSEAR